MQFPILVLTPVTRALSAALLVVSRGTLLLLALYHVPMVVPALYHVFELPPLSPLEVERLLLVFFALPEVAARIVCRGSAAMARVDSEALNIERGGDSVAVPLRELSVTPWLLPLPSFGLRLHAGDTASVLPGVAAADPGPLLSAMVAAGAPDGVGHAARHPLARYAAARARCRRWLDRPPVKFVVYPLVPAVVLFRLRQIVAYGGVLGEYHQFGLQAYLLGFGLYWLLSALYLLLFAAALRGLAEAVVLSATWAFPGWATGVRRIVEIVNRAVYYLAPPALMFVRLVLQ